MNLEPISSNASRYSVPDDNLVLHLNEDRRASISPWGKGNSKLGPDVYTFSKLPVRTCPGASKECLAHCYARKLEPNFTSPYHPVWRLWHGNTTDYSDTLPELPAGARLVRIHVSGDFHSNDYIQAWINKATTHLEVIFWGYTRSWTVPGLEEKLSLLHSLPNVHLWASMDKSMPDLPQLRWRRAWIEGDDRLTKVSDKVYRTFDGHRAVVCPESTGLMPNCQTCRFCFLTHDMDLVFPLH